VVSRQAQQSIVGAEIKLNSPHWNLSSVNIVPEDSEIINACCNLDLVTIQRLFDNDQASPYDVDNCVRNLLGWVSMGLQVLYISV
jgi:hypothetical protein